jgi:hypothetical protein
MLVAGESNDADRPKVKINFSISRTDPGSRVVRSGRPRSAGDAAPAGEYWCAPYRGPESRPVIATGAMHSPGRDAKASTTRQINRVLGFIRS